MAEQFSGDWTVEVAAATGTLLRFVIEGSLASNGGHPVSATMPALAVSGPHWLLRFEAFSPIPPKGWFSTDVRRIGAACTLQDGLDVFLRASVTFGLSPQQSVKPYFSECTLRCRNVDHKLNPWRPFTNPYDFTIPRRHGPIGLPGLPR